MRYAIKAGKAIIDIRGLRCAGPQPKPRPNGPQECSKLLVKKNALGQIAGEYKCERCGQMIEVECES